MVERLDKSCRFAHDRVQEAVYSQIPEDIRSTIHLLIGRLLVAQTAPEQWEETIFEIVNQLGRGAKLMTSRDERQGLAELNLVAAKCAKRGAAHASALAYCRDGLQLLTEACWEGRRELIFALELQLAECELLTGALDHAEPRLASLSTRAIDQVERAAIACFQIDLHMTLDQADRAAAIGLDFLRHIGVNWTLHPTE